MTEQVVRDSEHRLDTSKLATGLFLVALGVIFLADRLAWWDGHALVRLWPAWLIAFGLLRVAFPRRGRGRIAGVWPILIGGIFLLHTMDTLHIEDSWPLFIVAGGALIMLRAAGLDGRGRRDGRSGS